MHGSVPDLCLGDQRNAAWWRYDVARRRSKTVEDGLLHRFQVSPTEADPSPPPRATIRRPLRRDGQHEGPAPPHRREPAVEAEQLTRPSSSPTGCDGKKLNGFSTPRRIRAGKGTPRAHRLPNRFSTMSSTLHPRRPVPFNPREFEHRFRVRRWLKAHRRLNRVITGVAPDAGCRDQLRGYATIC